VTLAPCGGAGLDFGPQPAISSSAPSAMIFFSSTIFGILIGKVGPVPPAAAQRLEQGGGVGEAGGLRRKQGDFGLLIGLLGSQQAQRVGVAVLQLALGDGEGGFGGGVGGGSPLNQFGILLQGHQRVGDILEGAEQGGAVLSACGVDGGARRAFLVQQRAAVEDGRG